MHVTKSATSGLRRMYTKRDSGFKNRIFISASLFKQFICVFILFSLRRSLLILRDFEATQMDATKTINYNIESPDPAKPPFPRFDKLTIHTRKIDCIHWRSLMCLYNCALT
ncbi:hypothetical protein P5V15_003360 [Pogonomyrmex californicus]